MKKKLLAILLAVCLAVGCLPAPASAAQLTGSKEELKEFLNCYLLGNDFFSFDAEKALIPGWMYGASSNALYYLFYMFRWTIFRRNFPRQKKLPNSYGQQRPRG